MNLTRFHWALSMYLYVKRSWLAAGGTGEAPAASCWFNERGAALAFGELWATWIVRWVWPAHDVWVSFEAQTENRDPMFPRRDTLCTAFERGGTLINPSGRFVHEKIGAEQDDDLGDMLVRSVTSALGRGFRQLVAPANFRILWETEPTP